MVATSDYHGPEREPPLVRWRCFGTPAETCYLLIARKPAIDTQLLGLDWSVIISNLTHVLVAYLIALPIGWERERGGAGMGLRTFPLVALASCGYILVARDIAIANPDAQSRVIQGLLGGIGFIGGGAILKEGGSVRGTATAASIWNTGAIGLAVAVDRFEIAIVLGLINFVTLRWLAPLIHGVEAETHRRPPEERATSEWDNQAS